MHWIIQNNLFDEPGHEELITTLDKFGLPYDVVKIVPFTHTLEPEVNPGGPVIVMGAVKMSSIAQRRGWKPGSYHNANHNFKHWLIHYGDFLLNNDAKIRRLKTIDPTGMKDVFIRPIEDSKAFDGQVVAEEQFDEWRINLLQDGKSQVLGGDILVCYAPAKKIYAEYRFFIVDQKIITATQYKRIGKLYANSLIDIQCERVAQEVISLWQPARAYVLDIALVPCDLGVEGEFSEAKIVEINCINSAGFYKADVQKLVMALEHMEGER